MNTQQDLTSQQIISALQTMPLDELEKLVDNALLVRAERVAPHLTGEETKILKIIQTGLPGENLERMKELQKMRDNGNLSPAGFGELAQLIEKLEEIHAERLAAVVQLANLRGVSFQIALDQVGLKLPDYE